MKKILLSATAVAVSLMFCNVAKAESGTESLASAGAINEEIPVAKSTPKISGYALSNFVYEEGGANSFNLDDVALSVAGDLGTNFDYKIQIGFAGTPKIKDAYGRVKFNNAFNVQIGQFKLPFSLENELSPTSLETFDKSLIISNLCGGRDQGVALYGSFGDNNLAEYSVGVFNGAGTNKVDDNKFKDYVGRVKIKLPVEGLLVSGSFHLGNIQETAGGSRESYNRFAVGAKYDSESLFARSEYLWGGNESIKTSGMYALLGYWLTPRLSAIAKYDYMALQDYHEEAILGESSQWTAGFAYHLNSNVYFRLQYTSWNSLDDDKFTNGVGAGITIKF